MSRKQIEMSKMLVGWLLVGTTVCVLCSCSQKVAESNQSGDGYSQHIETVKEGDHLKTTTVTTEVEPNKDDSVNITTESGDGIHVKLPEDETGDSDVHVRAPFVKMDSDNNDGSVHVRAPFLKLDKGGYGDKVHIKIPGIKINSD